MDRVDLTAKVKEFFGKYKYVALILILGMILMSIPENETQETSQNQQLTSTTPDSKSRELEEILGQISGVGKVRVLLTEAASAETVYQTDEECSSSENSKDSQVRTVIITDSGRGEDGLVRTVTPPVYLGAIIVCQGGDSPSIRLCVVEAVSNATGLSSDRISVLKMK